MNLLPEFVDYVNTHRLFEKTDRLLLACSGGSDSMALATLCLKAGYSLALAHVNFQLRGEESDRDAAFVKAWAETNNIPFFINKADTKKYAQDKQINIQEAARAIRYEWFETLAKEKNFSCILTAHHADDSIETVLMNLFKGTGIAGLHGILPKNGLLRRPLLFAFREYLDAYVTEEQVPFITDSSNNDEKYTRNFLRLQVWPRIRERFAQAPQNMLFSIERFRESEMIYRDALQQKKKKLLLRENNHWRIPVRLLQKMEPQATLMYELIHEFGFSPGQLPDALHLLEAETGKYLLSPTHRLLKNREWLLITSLEHAQEGPVLIEAGDNGCIFQEGALHLYWPETGQPIPETTETAWLDASRIQFPLILRRWKNGDYFHPLGLDKKKKIARFLIDLKLSKADKEQVWVLESNKKIVWVVGHRIDHRMRVTESTKKILALKCTKRVESFG
jgi:tRNA(Ile)-lysidine synthase